MSSRVIKSGSTDQYCEVKVFTTATGAPKTDLVYNTSGLAIWYQIGNASPVQVVVGGSPAPASMSAGGAHADWGIYHVAQGRYKIGLADAAVSSAAQVTVWIAFIDCDSVACEIDVVGYDKTAVAVGALTDKTGFSLSTAANEAIGAAFLSHVLTKGTAGTIERAFWQILKTQASTDGAIVDDVANTATRFNTGITGDNGQYDHQVLVFVSGDLTGEARPIDTFTASGGVIVLQEALTAEPTAGDEFLILPYHVHPVSEIQSGLATSTEQAVSNDRLGYVLAALAGSCADAGTSGETYSITIGASTFTIDHAGLDATGNRGTATLTKS